MLRLNEEQITFNVFEALKFPTASDSCFQIDMEDREAENAFTLDNPSNPWEACVMYSLVKDTNSATIEECVRYLQGYELLKTVKPYKALGTGPPRCLPFIQQALKLELKQLPSHLWYTYFGDVTPRPHGEGVSLCWGPYHKHVSL